jgi:hypothetical protein
LLLAYALGAATSLALALLAGGRMLAFLKRTFRVGEWLRRGLGVAVLAGVVLVAAGLDVQLLSRISFASTASIEETLLNWTGVHGAAASTTAPIDDAASPSASAYGRQSWVLPPAPRIDSLALIDVVFTEASVVPPEVDLVTKIAAGTKADLPVEGALPGFSGSTEWVNSTPLTPQALRGKGVLVDFWTFNCFNCLNALPYVRAWLRNTGITVLSSSGYTRRNSLSKGISAMCARPSLV